jgi:hypothetical protein
MPQFHFTLVCCKVKRLLCKCLYKFLGKREAICQVSYMSQLGCQAGLVGEPPTRMNQLLASSSAMAMFAASTSLSCLALLIFVVGDGRKAICSGSRFRSGRGSVIPNLATPGEPLAGPER